MNLETVQQALIAPPPQADIVSNDLVALRRYVRDNNLLEEGEVLTSVPWNVLRERVGDHLKETSLKAQQASEQILEEKRERVPVDPDADGEDVAYSYHRRGLCGIGCQYCTEEHEEEADAYERSDHEFDYNDEFDHLALSDVHPRHIYGIGRKIGGWTMNSRVRWPRRIGRKKLGSESGLRTADLPLHQHGQCWKNDKRARAQYEKSDIDRRRAGKQRRSDKIKAETIRFLKENLAALNEALAAK